MIAPSFKAVLRACIMTLVLLMGPFAESATTYPPATGTNSQVLNGQISLRPGASGTTIAAVSFSLTNTPTTLVSVSQTTDGDTLDLLFVFRVDGGFPGGQIFTNDANLGSVPATIKRVRLLSRSIADPALPIVLHSEAQIGDQCLTLDPTTVLRVGAFEPIRLKLLAIPAASPVRPLRVVATGTSLDVYVDTGLATDSCPAAGGVASQGTELVIPGRAARSYLLRVLHYSGKIAATADLTIDNRGTRMAVRSLEFRTRGSYFMTASATDVTTLLSLVGPNQEQLWTLADDGFKAWSSSGDAPSTALGVCRFFNSRVSTHFYSARAEDCNALRGLPDWTDEGIAFRILLPEAGACLDGTNPVYRLFSPSLANHRYTSDAATYLTLMSSGWTGEGVAFCSPTN